MCRTIVRSGFPFSVRMVLYHEFGIILPVKITPYRASTELTPVLLTCIFHTSLQLSRSPPSCSSRYRSTASTDRSAFLPAIIAGIFSSFTSCLNCHSVSWHPGSIALNSFIVSLIVLTFVTYTFLSESSLLSSSPHYFFFDSFSRFVNVHLDFLLNIKL